MEDKYEVKIADVSGLSLEIYDSHEMQVNIELLRCSGFDDDAEVQVTFYGRTTEEKTAHQKALAAGKKPRRRSLRPVTLYGTVQVDALIKALQQCKRKMQQALNKHASEQTS